MTISRTIATSAAMSAMLLLGPMQTSGLAQTTSPAATPVDTTVTGATTTTNADQSHFDYGWLGLIGLLGLAGLMRRSDSTTTYTGTR